MTRIARAVALGALVLATAPNSAPAGGRGMGEKTEAAWRRYARYWRYWARALRRTLRVWDHHEGAALALLPALVAAVGVAGALPGDPQVWARVIGALAAGMGVWFVVVALLITPANMWNEARDLAARVAELMQTFGTSTSVMTELLAQQQVAMELYADRSVDPEKLRGFISRTYALVGVAGPGYLARWNAQIVETDGHPAVGWVKLLGEMVQDLARDQEELRRQIPPLN